MRPLRTELCPDFGVIPSDTSCCLACELMAVEFQNPSFIQDLLRSKKEVKDVHEGDVIVQEMLSKLSLHDKTTVLRLCQSLLMDCRAANQVPLIVHDQFYQRSSMTIEAITEPGFQHCLRVQKGSLIEAYYNHVSLSVIESFTQELVHYYVELYYKDGIMMNIANVPLHTAVKISFVNSMCVVQITEASPTGGCRDFKMSATTTHDEDLHQLFEDIKNILSLTERVSLLVIHIHNPVIISYLNEIIQMATWMKILREVYGSTSNAAFVLLIEQSIFNNQNKSSILRLVNDGIPNQLIPEISWNTVGIRVIRH